MPTDITPTPVLDAPAEVGYTTSYMHKAHGFTIVELLIVIVVIAILAALSYVGYVNIQSRAHLAAVQSDMSNNSKKLEEYRAVNGRYPETIVELKDSGVKFSLGSWRHAVYCVQNTGSSLEWALVARISGGGDVYRRSNNSGQTGTIAWSTNETVCTSAGLSGATAHWLRGSGDWTSIWQ